MAPAHCETPPACGRETAVLAAREVIAVTGGVWRGRGRPEKVSFRGVTIDSRKVQGGELFVALRGTRVDGHAFVRDALRRGAAACLVSQAYLQTGSAPQTARLIGVEDPLEALARLAANRRKRAGFQLVAVTGSVGKTTTKECIARLLSERYPTAKAPSSYNNLLGVSLTLLGAPLGTKVAVAEFGTSRRGEIADLARRFAPDHAVITRIGAAHLEGLGDLEGVLEEKLGILDGLGPEGMLSAPPETAAEAVRRGFDRRRTATFGFDRADLVPEEVRPIVGTGGAPGGYEIRVEGERLFLPFRGRHNVLNALAAVQVARRLGLTWAEIRKGLARCRLPPGRLEFRSAGGLTLIDDAYNSNPASLQAALETWEEEVTARRGRAVLVIGDMLELGRDAEAYHREAGRRIAGTSCAALVAVGPLAGILARACAEESRRAGRILDIRSVAEGEGALREILDLVRPGDVVLFKGSNRLRLSDLARRTAAALEEASDPEESPGMTAGESMPCPP